MATLEQIKQWEAEREALNLRRTGRMKVIPFEGYTSPNVSEFGDVTLATVNIGELYFVSGISRHPKRAVAHALRDLADILERESRED